MTWERIQQQGSIRVGMDANWVPFEYVDGSGELSGFDVDLAHELGRRLGLEVHIIANLSFDGLYDALTAQRADVVISAMVADMGRSADFAYSIPYFDAGQVLVVGPNGDHIKGLEDLGGQILAVELGSQGDVIARRWARRLTNLSLLHRDSAGDALTAVASGQANAALTDRATALMALREYSQQQTIQSDTHQKGNENHLFISGEPISDEQYAVVVRKESNDLLRAINAALTDMQQDGTLEALARTWLGP
jgi:ABC-type amino acid transport substrate-binding protein